MLVAIGSIIVAFRPDYEVELMPFYRLKYEKEVGNEREGTIAERTAWEAEQWADPKTGRIPANIRNLELRFAQTLPRREDVAGKNDNNLSWTNRGPFNFGGRIRALGVDVSNPSVIMAGGVSGGMWRSANGGQSWTRATTGVQLAATSCITQDTRTGRTATWYYGTGEIIGNSASITGASFAGNGIFKSTDNGQSWTQLASTTTASPQSFNSSLQYIFRVATDASNATQDEVYAAVFGGIIRSLDGGNTWNSVFPITTNPPNQIALANAGTVTDVVVTPSGVVYAMFSSTGNGGVAATTTGIWRSADGNTWTNITPNFHPSSGVQRITASFAPSNPNIVYFLVAAGTGNANHRLYKYRYLSGDGTGPGGRWFDYSANLPSATTFNTTQPGTNVANGAFDSQGGYDLHVNIAPTDTNLVFIGGTNVYRSTDGFANPLNNNSANPNIAWIGGYSPGPFTWPVHHPDQHDLAFVPNSNPLQILSANDGGLYRANATAQPSTVASGNTFWTSLNNGLVIHQFYSIAMDPVGNNDNIIVGGAQDNGTNWVNWTNATASNATWTNSFGGDGVYTLAAQNKAFYIMGSQNGNYYRVTLDGVGNIVGFTKIVPVADGSGPFTFVNPVFMDPNDSRVIYMPISSSNGTNSTVWINTNITGIPASSNNPSTVNWTQLTATTQSSGRINSLGISTTNPSNRIYYGTSTGRVFRMDVNLAAPTTTTPTEVTGSNFPVGNVRCLAVDPTNANNVLAVFSNYNILSIFYTTNGGSSWTPVSGNLEQNPDGTGNGPAVAWISILPVGGGNLEYYVGTSTGLYSTTSLNGMNTQWLQEAPNGIGNVPVHMVVSRASDRTIAVGTHGRGAFTAQVGTGPTSLAQNQTPDRIFSVDSWPNPCNTQTGVYYSVSSPTSVTVDVLGPNGNVIQTLPQGLRNPGVRHEAMVNAENLSSGLYFYRVTTTDGQSRNGKFMVVK